MRLAPVMAMAGGLAMFAASLAAAAADVFKGRELYARYCEQCHGADGRGALVGAPDFTRSERLLCPDLELLGTVRAGKGAMPAFQGILTSQQLLDVIAHLRTLQR